MSRISRREFIATGAAIGLGTAVPIAATDGSSIATVPAEPKEADESQPLTPLEKELLRIGDPYPGP
jgi:hypothetical protein